MIRVTGETQKSEIAYAIQNITNLLFILMVTSVQVIWILI